MGSLLGLADKLDTISRSIGKAASWIILPLVGLIMLDVVTRKIAFIKEWSAEITIQHGFSVSFILQDLQWHLHGMLMLLTFGFGYLLNAHVRVDIFREGASKRGQVKIETLGLLICAIPFLLVMIWFSFKMTQASWLQWEGSESQVGLGWRWFIKSFLVWGFVVAVLAATATLFRCLNYLYGTYDEQALAEDKIQFFTDVDTLPKVVIEPDGNIVAPTEERER